MGRKTKPFATIDKDVVAAAQKKLASREYAWIRAFTAAQEVDVRRLINYGCNIGAETLALVVEFDLKTAVGVDANLDHLKHGQASIGNATAGDSAIITGNATVGFVGSDIVEGIGLRAAYFDIGYGADVLDKVVAHAVDSPEVELRRAVTEMVRVIRPGGIVAVEGEVANKDGEEFDLNRFFRDLSMKPLPVPNDDARVRRAYRKQDT